MSNFHKSRLFIGMVAPKELVIIWLVVDLPLWRIWVRQLRLLIIPNIWKNNKCSKPPTSQLILSKLDKIEKIQRLSFNELCSNRLGQPPPFNPSASASEALRFALRPHEVLVQGPPVAAPQDQRGRDAAQDVQDLRRNVTCRRNMEKHHGNKMGYWETKHISPLVGESMGDREIENIVGCFDGNTWDAFFGKTGGNKTNHFMGK